MSKHVTVVKSYDEAAILRALRPVPVVNHKGSLKYENGLIHYPTVPSLVKERLHYWDFQEARPEALAAWSKVNAYTWAWLQRKISSRGRARLAKTYGVDEDYAFANHIAVLAHPHVQTVKILASLKEYWTIARRVKSSAEKLNEESLGDSARMSELLSSVVVAAEELMLAIETLDDRGLALTTDQAPDLHRAFLSSLDKLTDHFEALTDEDAQGSADWIAHLTKAVQDTAATVDSILAKPVSSLTGTPA